MGYHYSPHVQFELKIEPEQEIFKAGNELMISTSLLTAPYDDAMMIDLYFAMIDPENTIYSGSAWDKGLQPLVADFSLPADLSLDNIPLLDITIPSDKPPICMQGTYIFAIVATKPGTVDFISNLSTVSFEVE